MKCSGKPEHFICRTPSLNILKALVSFIIKDFLEKSHIVDDALVIRSIR